MIKTFVSLFVLVAFLSNESYGQKNEKHDYEILVLGETPLFMDSDTLREASLTEKDISDLIGLTDKCVQRWNEKMPLRYTHGNRIDRISQQYYKQYLAAYNESGEKIVWINFLRKKDVKELPKKLVIITDSQYYNSYWVNLDQSRIID